MTKTKTQKPKKTKVESDSFIEFWNSDDLDELKTELDVGIKQKYTEFRATIHSSDDDLMYYN